MLPYIEIETLKIPIFPIIILFAIFSVMLFYIKSPSYPKQFALDFISKIIPVLIGAAIGGKIAFAISVSNMSLGSFWQNLFFGGSVYYGGIIGGCIGLAIICATKSQPFLEYSDVLVSLLPLGHAIGRVGCYFNGCCYGCPYNGFISMEYPVDGAMVRVFPAWFVEAMFCILVFVFFQYIFKTNIRGIRTAIYFISYSTYRFFIEYVRGDDIRGYWGCLTTSQIISVFTLILGFGILFYSFKKKLFNYMIIKENTHNAI